MDPGFATRPRMTEEFSDSRVKLLTYIANYVNVFINIFLKINPQ
jgi:hypothetical protein